MRSEGAGAPRAPSRRAVIVRGMNAMRPVTLLAALALAVACGGGSAADDGITVPPVPTPVTAIPVTFGTSRLNAALATTAAARTAGLANRGPLPADSAMLFVFAQPQQLFFYMKNTRFDLDIAFLDASKRVLNIRQMTAYDSVTIHSSQGFAQYALEANRGWFAANGVTAGSVATFTLPAGTVIDP